MKDWLLVCLFWSVPAWGQIDPELLERAEQGDASAQWRTGFSYQEGIGMPRDLDQAVKWYRLAAIGGLDRAQINLAEMYAQGHGVSRDVAEAAKWYRLAAEQGHVAAQTSLGNLYAKGDGMPQDFVEADKWYRLAAELGHAEAQYNLGVMYGVGQGVPQDYVLGYMWINLAASRATGLDQKYFTKGRDAVLSSMTPDQISEAQRLAREWKPKTWEELKPKD